MEDLRPESLPMPARVRDVPEAQLLPPVARGEAGSLEAVIDRYSGLVWSLARSVVPDRSEAEDAVQEIFIHLWTVADRFDPERASEATFIAMIARRRLIDRYRRTSRYAASRTLETAAEEELVAPPHDPAPAPWSDAETKRVLQALGLLRPIERTVIELALGHGRTHEQIAKSLDLPLGTVKTHARRGLIRVREYLELEEAHGKADRP